MIFINYVYLNSLTNFQSNIKNIYLDTNLTYFNISYEMSVVLK